MGLAPLPCAPEQPTKVGYRRTLGARYAPSANPVYAAGVPVHERGAVALDQLRRRHPAPLEAPSLARVQAITGWGSAPLCPPPQATISNPRAVIHRAVAQLAVVTDTINDILRGSPVPQAHSADFINLRKSCHTAASQAAGRSLIWPPCGSSRPLCSKTRKYCLVSGGILPAHQFGMSPQCSSVELLRVLHDVWSDRWRRRLEAWVPSDDVRHAYGSINHNTKYAILAAAGVPAADAKTL